MDNKSPGNFQVNEDEIGKVGRGQIRVDVFMRIIITVIFFSVFFFCLEITELIEKFQE